MARSSPRRRGEQGQKNAKNPSALVPPAGEDVRWARSSVPPVQKEFSLTTSGHGYTPEQAEHLKLIYERLVEARRELDALIGDAYLRPRANIVPVHFLDLASAVEKLRWAEKEWREIHEKAAEQEAEEERPRNEVDDLVTADS